MLPDDCSECQACGVPVFGRGELCIDCDPVRDDKGRFVSKALAEQYRALLKQSLGYYGVNREEELEARTRVRSFFRSAAP